MNKDEKLILERLDRLEKLIGGVLEKLNEPERLTYDVTEAAEALGVSPRHMYDLIHREDLHTLKSGSRRLISVEALKEWVRKQAQKGGAG